MGDGFQFIDIIFFAMIAGFLVLRLRSVLGRRTGEERQRHKDWTPSRGDEAGNDNVVAMPGREPDQARPAEPSDDASPVERGVFQIQLADPSFDPDEFVTGARGAFEMIVTAFAEGDRKTLKSLLSEEVYEGFEQAITEREKNDQSMSTELVSEPKSRIIEAEMQDSIANVTVEFESEQTTVVRDAEGTVVEGDPTRLETVTDHWTFARDTRSRDPNWFLVGTHSPED